MAVFVEKSEPCGLACDANAARTVESRYPLAIVPILMKPRARAGNRVAGRTASMAVVATGAVFFAASRRRWMENPFAGRKKLSIAPLRLLAGAVFHLAVP